MSGRLPQNQPSFAQVSLPVQDGGTSQRIIHDVPPVWDGKDPDNQAEPYLKLLQGWLNTTRTLKTQRGMTILHYSHGDLKLIINELDVDTLTHETSGQTIFNHVKKAYAEYLAKKLPKAMEKSLFDPAGHRKRGESMLQYISRKKTLLWRVRKTDCPLPSNFRGYMLLRDAKLPPTTWDTIDTWTRGSMTTT